MGTSEEYSVASGEHQSSACASKRPIIIVVAVVLLIGIIIAIAVPLALRDSEDEDDEPAKAAAVRVDCYPEAEGVPGQVDIEKCTDRGCSYDPSPPPDQPTCFYAEDQIRIAFQNVQPSALGYSGVLNVTGQPPFGGDIRLWKFTFENRGNNLARFTFDTISGNRYKVPKVMNLPNVSSTAPAYEIKLTNNQSFAFQIIRKATGTVIWDIDVGPGGLVLSDQFLQITTKLPSTNVYGLGEHVHDSFRHEMGKTWPSFSRDQPPSWDKMANLYGVHPFYTCVEDREGNTHGILMLNSNAQEYAFTNLPSLTFRTIGGILDFYIFMGPTPEQVVQQYTEVVGRPAMPPYWALGFQLSRYGYNNISNLKDAVESTAAYDIPHDVQYVDIDHMDTQKIFTVDQDRFPNLNEYFKSLQDQGMRIIYILDPCMISNETNYRPYEEMKQIGGNIKWASNVTAPADSQDTDGALLGYVWPQGKTVFPDYLKDSVKQVWKELIVDYRKNLTFDGLWIDMNEPASFGTNEERSFNWPEDVRPYWSLKCPINKWEDPPYRPKAAYRWDNQNKQGRLSDKTICMSTVQGNNDEYSHYDVHSLYGWSQSDITLEAAREATGERSIVISRSTFPGSGHYVGHWLGDNVSQWKDMHSSIIGLLEFNLFGIPYIGADICGFFDNTTPQLCKRWMQLGAFYTFSRNHNGINYHIQGPGQLGDDVGNASRDIMRIRYKLLPYLYTLFHEAHVQGSTVIRPLHHEFPSDQVALSVDKQFLWGACLLISPILEENQTELEYYLPAGRWYDYFTHKREEFVQGQKKEVPVNDDSMPLLHLRGGCIMVQQDYANNTHFSRQKPLTMMAALDAAGRAEGSLFLDDGVSIDSVKDNNYYMASIKTEDHSLSLTVSHKTFQETEWDKIHFSKLVILGVEKEIMLVTTTFGNQSLEFIKKGQTLEVDLPNIPMREEFSVTWYDARIDCYPEAEGSLSVNQSLCSERGCTYDPDLLPGYPTCFYNEDQYRLTVTSVTNTALGLQATLEQNGKAPFGGDITNWLFAFENKGDHIARFTFDTAKGDRYKVPKMMDLPTTPGMSPLYEIRLTNNQSFAFQILRKATGTVIWDIDVGPGGLVLSDQFLQITTKLPSKNVYGLGEHVHNSFRHEMSKTWPSFSRDQPPSWDEMANLYGVHPFYTCVEDSQGSTHGIFMLNSNAQEYSFADLPSLTFRTIGGILDFYIFMGPAPEQVVEQYTGAIGRPAMPPYWALGFQLSRYGYNNIDNLKEAVNSTAMYDIPHDVQYVDIDHMDTQKIFTVDHDRFPNLNEYFKSLQEQGMRIIYILDPCMISNETNYQPYEEMKKIGGNIKWASNVNVPADSQDTDGALLGYVWPVGKTVFPDYLKNSVKQVWKKLIVNYRKNLTFDGLWIDMNEPASFGTNEERPFNWPEDVRPYWSLKCPSNTWEDPPYRSKAAYRWDDQDKQGRLSDKTICMSTLQGNNDEYFHYDVHSLYGWSQSDVTLEAAREATGERSIVISRSTFPGSGHYVGHWLGDNVSQWKDMHSSIIGLLEFSLFGIPYIGADICGFFENTSPQLCKRWMQLGAFYTFSRNHNGINNRNQGPGQLGDDVGKSSRDIMRIRYQLLPYLYTLFHEAHTLGSTVIRPLHHEFPTDDMALSVDKQFLWGACLLISPILEENQTSLEYYLPKGKWYNYYTHVAENASGESMRTMTIDDQTMPRLHVRGGCAMVLQDYANNTHFSRQKPLSIVVALDESERSEGSFFWDDGASIDSLGDMQYFKASIKVEDHSLSMKVIHRTPTATNWDNLHFNRLVIMGVSLKVESVTMPGHAQKMSFNQTGEVLQVLLPDLSMRNEFSIRWNTPAMDCYPEAEGQPSNINQSRCEMRGCSYHSNPPSCVYKKDEYRLSVSGISNTNVGFQATLMQKANAPFGGDIPEWLFTFENQGDHIAHFSFDTLSGDRYKVPMKMDVPQTPGFSPLYEIRLTNNQSFAFQILRKATGTVIWDIDVGPGGLVLSDQFLQITTKLPSRNVYGLGEHVHRSFRHEMDKTWPSFSRDQPPSWDEMANLYGVQPFYTCVEDAEGNTHGILLLNSNAQEYSFTSLPSLTFRTIGGILDFYVFMGPTPEEVVQQYTGAIGRPVMPPYWSLGFQLSRYGYNSINNLKEAVESTARYDIPHDVQYVDIDHMDTQKIFTVAHDRFPNLNEFFKSLQEKGMRIIYILDPCMISNETNYQPYEEMKNIGGNIKWASNVTVPAGSRDTDGAILGYVWPMGKTVFPDFLKPSVKQVWKNLITDYRKNLTFDGLWIDMNEPANFGTNEERPFNWPENVRPYWSLECPTNSWEDPPYRPKAAYRWDKQNKPGRLSDKTICMSTMQGNNSEYSHYDVHSLYGWSQSDVTLEAAREATGERSIVISRSTFPGSGHYVGHWLGDNVSQWKDMHSSIIGLLEFNLFGIPYIGADICGFFENTTPQLCKRWMQLGAFYTFSRNHNGINWANQGPGQLGDDVGKASRDIMRIRYQLLPYLYTLFHEAHTQGSTVIRPLHHEFPTDVMALSVDRQFLWGACLLISPILEENQTSLEYYLPRGKWYNFYSHMAEETVGGSMRRVAVDDNSMPLLHVRGGCAMVLQDHANNTHFSRQKPLSIAVALDESERSEGSFFWDDGVSIDSLGNGQYFKASIIVENHSLSLRIIHRTLVAANWDNLYFNRIVIMGVSLKVESITLAGHGEKLSFNQTGEVLEVLLPNLPMRNEFSIRWNTPAMDCYPEAEGQPSNINQSQCEMRGCSYHSDPPSCVYNKDQYNLSVSEINNTDVGFQAKLMQKGNAPFGGDIPEWLFTFENRGDHIAHFKFDTVSGGRYEVPKKMDVPQTPSLSPLYEIRLTNNQSFAFQILRKVTGTVIWDIDVGPGSLVLSDQFLQITTKLPSGNVYGLGEHVHSKFKHEMGKTWPSFSRDQPPSWDKMANLYGVHPYYTCVEDAEGNTHGILLLNSNAQEYSFTSRPSLTFRTVGGILDFYVFMGPTPEEVVQQYTGAIGRPAMPPYWALGFQLSRYGYNNIDNLKEAVESTAKYNIPHDVQYVDIDHMDTQKIFTVDHDRFPNLNEYFKSLQEQGMRIIYILDPCMVSNETNYRPYEEMKHIGGNIKWASNVSVPADSRDTDGALLGYVWPVGKTVFPDFFKTSVKQVWKDLILDHRNNLTFDGLWIDMNEPASFGTNEERPFNWPEDVKPYWSLKCPKNSWEDPPYRPKAAYRWDDQNKPGRLSDKTICMSTVQGNNDEYSHYNVHSLYGWSQSEITLEAAREATGERSIVISRSTFPGSGQYVGHWLGDNVSQWKDMHSSIIGLLEFSLFGIPYIGADICGFFENTTPQLCKRWMQLGAFYTFSRNHNGINWTKQGPGQLGDDVGNASMDIMRIRYQLLPYLYMLFHEAHTQGSTVIRPVHHEFVTDVQALSVDAQFMWGACLLISPILEENQTVLEYYLPKGKWYNFYTDEGVVMSEGKMIIAAVDADTKPFLHLRGGCSMMLQGYANNTHFSRKEPLTLVAALDVNGTAKGSIFWDDGTSIDNLENNKYYKASLTAGGNSLTLTVSHTMVNSEWDNLQFEAARILGVSGKVTRVSLKNSTALVPFSQDGEHLEIRLPSLPLIQNFTISWHMKLFGHA